MMINERNFNIYEQRMSGKPLSLVAKEFGIGYGRAMQIFRKQEFIVSLVGRDSILSKLPRSAAISLMDAGLDTKEKIENFYQSKGGFQSLPEIGVDMDRSLIEYFSLTKHRSDGYYWVLWGEDWVVAKFEYTKWFIPSCYVDCGDGYIDDEIDEIDERQILRGE